MQPGHLNDVPQARSASPRSGSLWKLVLAAELRHPDRHSEPSPPPHTCDEAGRNGQLHRRSFGSHEHPTTICRIPSCGYSANFASASFSSEILCFEVSIALRIDSVILAGVPSNSSGRVRDSDKRFSRRGRSHLNYCVDPTPTQLVSWDLHAT